MSRKAHIKRLHAKNPDLSENPDVYVDILRFDSYTRMQGPGYQKQTVHLKWLDETEDSANTLRETDDITITMPQGSGEVAVKAIQTMITFNSAQKQTNKFKNDGRHPVAIKRIYQTNLDIEGEIDWETFPAQWLAAQVDKDQGAYIDVAFTEEFTTSQQQGSEYQKAFVKLKNNSLFDLMEDSPGDADNIVYLDPYQIVVNIKALPQQYWVIYWKKELNNYVVTPRGDGGTYMGYGQSLSSVNIFTSVVTYAGFPTGIGDLASLDVTAVLFNWYEVDPDYADTFSIEGDPILETVANNQMFAGIGGGGGMAPDGNLYTFTAPVDSYFRTDYTPGDPVPPPPPGSTTKPLPPTPAHGHGLVWSQNLTATAKVVGDVRLSDSIYVGVQTFDPPDPVFSSVYGELVAQAALPGMVVQPGGPRDGHVFHETTLDFSGVTVHYRGQPYDCIGATQDPHSEPWWNNEETTPGGPNYDPDVFNNGYFYGLFKRRDLIAADALLGG